jgi:NAD(P)-dependent dehydrogenase (short-subunit alcohol dehydrogenase family)
MLLEGKVALVTGGSRGLGKAICLAYAREGAAIITCARDDDRLRVLEKELSEVTSSYLALPADLSKPEDVNRLVGAGVSKFNRIDILVNNASLLGPRVPIIEYPEDDWRTVIDVNLSGVFFITKAVLRHMVTQRSGSIINISSSVGRHGRARWGAYAVSKFGLEGLTQILAEELKPYNIRVNSVNPGAMATEMRRAAYPDEDQSKLKRPENILDIFLFLASDSSDDRTGGLYDAQTFVRPA